jgi:hypothetical protein
MVHIHMDHYNTAKHLSAYHRLDNNNRQVQYIDQSQEHCMCWFILQILIMCKKTILIMQRYIK